MKKKILLFVLLLHRIGFSQFNPQGSWKGSPEGLPTKLEMIINFSMLDTIMVGKMSVPAQKAFDIPVDNILVENDSIYFDIKGLAFHYSGKLEDSTLIGKMTQQGNSYPLNLTKHNGVVEYVAPKRPQNPTEPYPFYVEEITFFNNENTKFGGTLFLPSKEGKYPVVVMISGSGPQDRTSEVFDHKLFLVAAHYFTEKGIGVLRYDDRGVGESEGNRKGATSLDYSYDAEGAVNYLKDKHYASSIGLYGHSEGALIAPMVASRNNEVDFLVLVGAPGVRGDKLLLKQIELGGLADGVTKKLVKNNVKASKIMFDQIIKEQKINTTETRKKLVKLFKDQGTQEEVQKLIDQDIAEIERNDWLQYFLKTDPKQYLEKVSVPIIAITGGLDKQVDAKQNLSAINKILKKNRLKDYTTKELEGHNHLMQHAETGAVMEYEQIEETASIEFLEIVANWIKDRYL